MHIMRDYDADWLTMGAVSGAAEAKHQSGLSDLSLGSYMYYRTVYGASRGLDASDRLGVGDDIDLSTAIPLSVRFTLDAGRHYVCGDGLGPS